MKLPAYARGVLARRFAGNHPFALYLLFSDDWSNRTPPHTMPFLAIAPREYRPGGFDLRCVSGLDVYLEASADGWHALAGELDRLARHVWWRSDTIEYRYDSAPRQAWESFNTLALAYRLSDGVWPAWSARAHERRAA